VTDFYVKGYRPFVGLEYVVVVPTRSKPVICYASGNDEPRIELRNFYENIERKGQVLYDDVRKIGDIHEWHSTIAQILKEYSLEKGVIGTDIMPFFIYKELKANLQDIVIKDASDVWTELTVIKHEKEIELIRKSLEITDIGLQAAISAIKPGISEREVAAEAEYHMRNAGSEFVPFLTEIESGQNSAIYERNATEKIIRNGELVIIDIGSVYKGYTGDAGRTVIVGKPKEEQRKIYRADYEALQAAINAVEPGRTCAEIDQIAREKIAEKGFSKYASKFVTGHQLGYGLHGEPLITEGIDFVLRPNMVICLEPRILLADKPDIGGVHLEDAVLVTEDGHEVLTKTPFDRELLQ
jgi:Xaa-Pro aminopeptidase